MTITATPAWDAAGWNAVPPQKAREPVPSGEGASPPVKTDQVDISPSAAYFRGLQERFPRMHLSLGTGFDSQAADHGDRWAFTMDPALVETMRSHPEAEEALIRRLQDIQRATSLAETITQAMGMKTIRCGNFIDGDGRLHHFSISVRRDEGNQRLREAARKNTERLIERVREQNQAAAERIAEKAAAAEESGEFSLDEEDMRLLADAAAAAGNPDRETDAASEEGEAAEKKGMIGINAAKLARKLAAAKTRSQVLAVIAAIQEDLRECRSGRAQGMDVDEGSVKAAERLLGEAKQRLGSAENREATPEEEMASALASLF